MVTITDIKGSTQSGKYIVYEISGLSTDDKPTVSFNGAEIVNGCKYIEINTGKVYLYDAENEQWNEF